MSFVPRRRVAGIGCALIPLVLLLAPGVARAGTGGVAVEQATADRSVAIAGHGVTYTVRVGAAGTSAAGVEVVAALPVDVDVIAASAPGGCDTVLATCVVGDLPAGAAVDVTFTVRPGLATPDPMVARFTASATDAAPDTADDDSRAVARPLELPGPTTLAATGVATPGRIVQGDALSLQVDVRNAGADSAADGLELELALPPGASGIAAHADAGTCTDGATVVCALAPIPIGASSRVTVTLRTSAVAPGDALASARVWQQGERGAEAPSATVDVPAVIVPVGPVDVAVALTDTPEPVFSGQGLRYTATVENLDRTHASGPVVTTIDLPAGVEVLAADGCSAAGGDRACSVDRLAPGERATFQLDVRVPRDAPPPPDGRLRATAIAALADDTATGNNAVTRETTLVPVVELGRAIASDPAIVHDADLEDAPSFASADAIGTDLLAGFPLAGASYALLTTGDARLAGTPNTGGAAGVGISTTADHGAYDATVLELEIDAPATARCLRLDLRFLTEEAPELDAARPDTFLAQLDDDAWSVGPGATVNAGPPAPFARIQPSATGVAALTTTSAAGTTYDAATAILRAQTPIGPGRHHLYLSLFDVGTNGYDSAVLLDRLELDPTGCTAGLAPAPPPAPATVSIGDVTIAEGGGSATVELTLSRAVAVDTVVSLETRPGTASEGVDFVRLRSDKTIAAGRTVKPVLVGIVGDALDEADLEAFTLAITGTSQAIGDGTATVEIADDDAPPRVSVVDASVPEGAAGSSLATVAIELDARSGREVRVLVRTRPGSAHGGAAPGGGVDYLETERELVLAPGDRRARLPVAILGDTAVEHDEQLGVAIVRATSATVARAAGTVTIVDDDGGIPPVSLRKPLRIAAFATPSSIRRGGVATYRLALRNPNRVAVRVIGLRICLPVGFSLVRRSGAGALRGVPTRAACGRGRALLRWRNAVTIAGGRTAKMRVGVRAGRRRGRFTITVSGTAASPWRVRSVVGAARLRVR